MTDVRSDGPRKRVFIRTYGCQMNVYDSDRMADVLRPLGYAVAETPDQADLVVLNTCHIREHASEKVYSELGRLRDAKIERRAEGRDLTIAVAGCVAQAEGEEIVRRQPAVDIVVGPQAYHRLPELLAEARQLVAAGAIEITLLGQNVNAYHGDAAASSHGTSTWSLARLIHALAEIEGVARIRYTTSHPRDMDEALIAAHGSVPQLMPYLHLPVQSGADRILEAMNRRHGRDLFLGLVDRLRTARPDLALSSDFIVGFPGESDADFDDTMRLVEQVGFASAYSFKYSRRPGTPGSALPDQVPEALKSARLAALQALLGRQARDFNISKVGTTVPVLFTEPGRKPGQIIGKTPWLQSVYADGPTRLIGRIVDAHLIEGHANSLAGEIVVGGYEVAA